MSPVLLPIASSRSVSSSFRVRSVAAGEAGFCTVRVRSRCAHSTRRGSQYSPRKIASMPFTSVSSELSVKNTPFIDRKSTRLNSSHLVISYAVFCLKKKSSLIDNREQYSQADLYG